MKSEELFQQLDNFEEFLRLCSKAPEDELLAFLSEKDCKLLDIAIKKFSQEQMLQIFNCIFDDYKIVEEQDVFNIEKITVWLSKRKPIDLILLGLILTNLPTESFTQEEIQEMSTWMNLEYFTKFINQTPITCLEQIFLRYSPETSSHMLELVSTKIGVKALNDLLVVFHECDSEKIKEELLVTYVKRPVYAILLEILFPNVEVICKIINRPSIEKEVIQLMVRHHQKLSFDQIFSMLEVLSADGLWSVLSLSTADQKQSLFIETLIGHSENPDKLFLNIMNLFPNPQRDVQLIHLSGGQPCYDFVEAVSHSRHTLYKYLTCPIGYATVKKFSSNSTKNSVLMATTAMIEYIPILGESIKEAVDTHQKDVELTEYMIHRLSRVVPKIESALGDLLIQLSPIQCFTLLKKPDSKGNTLFRSLFRSCGETEIVSVLAHCPYNVKDKDRLIKTEDLRLSEIRPLFRHHKEGSARVGLMVFMNLYIYIQVRSFESGASGFEKRKRDYINLLSHLMDHVNSAEIKNWVGQYLSQHSIDDSWKIKTAVKELQLGTNRYDEARRLILNLTQTEIKEGFLSFYKFILKRIEVGSVIGMLGLEHEVVSAIQKKTENDFIHLIDYEDQQIRKNDVSLKN